MELGSDQTSLHNPFGGGYYPVQLGFEEAHQVMKDDPQRFKQLVQERCAVLDTRGMKWVKVFVEVCVCVCVCV